jgi:hypothetical protein
MPIEQSGPRRALALLIRLSSWVEAGVGGRLAQSSQGAQHNKTCSGRAMPRRVAADHDHASAQLEAGAQEREPSGGQPGGHPAALAGAQPERAGAEANGETMAPSYARSN